MKKNPLFFPLFLFILSGVWGLQIEDRSFEVGFDAGIDFSNNFLSAGDIFQDIFVIDLDKLENGLRLNAGADIIPFYFSYNSKKGWGFGLSAKAQATGIFDLSGKMLTFTENPDDDGKSEINGALFAEAAVSFNFNYKKFKINVRPAVFLPVAYAVSDIMYNFNETAGGTILNLGYDMNLYTAIPMENSGNTIITAKPGVDFSIGVEYPLSETLGISDLFFFLDFDVGIEFNNIPVAAGTISDYLNIKGNIGSDEPVSLFGEDADLEKFFNIEDSKYLSDERTVFRPFKILIYAPWRPLGSSLLAITPSIGFAISPINNEKFSMEGGIKGRLNLNNLFFLTLGTGYHDRLWNHSVDIALNFRAVEFNIAAALCSPDFLKSWSGSGFNINAGLKFGW